MTAALDRAVANALGFKSVHNCERWSKTMIEDDDDIQVYKKPWVGLTDEEIDYQAKKDDHGVYFALGALWAEAKLKEKNNGL